MITLTPLLAALAAPKPEPSDRPTGGDGTDGGIGGSGSGGSGAAPLPSPTPTLEDLRTAESLRSCTRQDGLCERVYDLTGSRQLAEAADWLIAKPFAVIGLLVLAVVARWVVHRLVNRLAARAAEGTVPGVLQRGRKRPVLFESNPLMSQRRAQRAQTMGSLLKSISTGVIFAVALVMILAELGLNIAPLIASAGIIGLALGFGAQSLVRDFLSGIFMIMEDQYGVGDVVDLGEATGSVEAVGLRVTRLRDVNGTVWYVRNGEILRVGNMSQNWARSVLDVTVSFKENVDRVQEVLREVSHALVADEEWRPLVLEEPEIWGVERMDPEGVTVRVVLKTAPQEQWKVSRELRRRVKERFDAEGIEMPDLAALRWLRAPAPPPA